MAEMDFSRLFSGASPVLSGLAPIPVLDPTVGGGNIRVQPIAAIQPVSTQPELVAAGIGKGLEALGQGYFGGIMQKKKDAKDEIERKRKSDLDERQMKLEEAKVAHQKDKELRDRLAAVGADKFPGESNAFPAGSAQPPQDQPIEDQATQVGQNAARLARVGSFIPEAYTETTKPFEKEKYSREVNTPRFSPEKAFEESKPPQQLEIVPKPLSQGVPSAAPAAAPSKALANVPVVTDPSIQRPSDGVPKNRAQELVMRGFTPAPGDENLPPTNEAPIVTAGKQAWSWLKGVKEKVEQTEPNGMAGTPWEQGGARYRNPAERVVEKPSEVADPQASYQFPEEKWKQLQQATASENLKELSPYATASADTGDRSTDKTPALSPTLPVPEAKPTYPLDISKLYDIQYKETPGATAQQPVQQTPKAQANPFVVPERPKASEIPKDFATRDYAAARAEQAKNYGFYYEPMGRIETHKDPNGSQWYKVVRDPEKASIIEQKLGRLETMSQRYDKYKLQEQNTIDREQTKFYSNPDVKAFTAPNGMRQSFSRFVKDYDAIAKNPEASGISDIGLLDMFGRAEGGGRITEGQAALALRAVGILDKPELLIQNLQGGARLSPNQRDQMLRVIAEDHAAQANLANQQIAMVRKKLQRQGITDEDMLPQPFIVPVTKWEAEDAKTQARAETTKLVLARTQAQQAGNQTEVDNINRRLQELKDSIDPIYEMEKKSKGSVIINMHDIEHTPQGWAGGAVATFQQQGE